MLRSHLKAGQRGAAAIEYVIVSLFAALIALTAIAYVGRVVKKKVEEIASKMGMEGEFEFEIDTN